MTNKKYDLAAELPEIDFPIDMGRVRRAALIAGGVTLGGVASAAAIKRIIARRDTHEPASATKNIFELREGLDDAPKLHLDMVVGYLAAKKSAPLVTIESFAKLHMTRRYPQQYDDKTFYQTINDLVIHGNVVIEKEGEGDAPFRLVESEDNLKFMLDQGRQKVFSDMQFAYHQAIKLT